MILRLLALALALCALAGCSLLPGGTDEYAPGDVLELLYEDTADELVLLPDETPADETPAAPKTDPPSEPDPAPEPVAEAPAEAPQETEELTDNAPPLDPEGSYTTRDAVAQYLHYYGELPSNFITKKEARALGWSGGGLEDYAPGKSIGGDRFGNYEGLLPDAPGREYHECDIDPMGASSRGAKRIVYSNDGLIYYTDDHYESFTLLYPEE